MKPVRKLLVANRGEIACRIFRTARRLGIETVAVFSDADCDALHVREADTAYRIGPAAAAQSYLDGPAILEAATRAKADAIHPGYGFLSEDATFAAACSSAGINFVGPSAEAIAAMGDKARAKAAVCAAGVAVVPGYDGAIQDEARLTEEAAAIGFPLLIKAVAGGGGRGMRIVRSGDELGDALASAKREAKAAFGNDSVLLERLVEDGRHIEIQVFGDSQGNIVHLFERDCSAQRRHQKIIEEAPSAFISPRLRDKLCNWAVSAARAVSYQGAGTVEFIVSPQGEAYFLEMNTRLQVEHPVTEMITGFDLVEWQLRVAGGEALPQPQRAIAMNGHSIELRLYAEDAFNGFLPQTGLITDCQWPDTANAAIRVDTGVQSASLVTSHYDAMVAKLIVHGEDRAEALVLARQALDQTRIGGVGTNKDFLSRLVSSGEFMSGSMHTATIDRWIATDQPIMRAPQADELSFIHAGLAMLMQAGGDWFRSMGHAQTHVTLRSGEATSNVSVRLERGRPVEARCGGTSLVLDNVKIDGDTLRVETEGAVGNHAFTLEQGGIVLHGRKGQIRFFTQAAPGQRRQELDPTRPVSPVSGALIRLLAEEGMAVEPGAPLAIVEAMKMETTISSAIGGTVSKVTASAGNSVRAGDVICEITPSNQETGQEQGKAGNG
ncbi:MAG: biotin carboxylase N-terminal domain-containing protein [Rhizobiaceae bacterium]